ncbi:MAG: hypothetical protein K2Y28_04475 [Burkholderiaceae bacterium]|nr:hypothetical protein [Burkholderiaceae bacterium]
MSLQRELIFVLVLGAAILAMNSWATLLIWRDVFSERRQRAAQLLIVWLLPIFGSLIVFAVHRSAEKPSGKYQEAPDPGDDFGFSKHSSRHRVDHADSD